MIDNFKISKSSSFSRCYQCQNYIFMTVFCFLCSSIEAVNIAVETSVPQTFFTLIFQTHDGIPLNVATQKGNTKLYMDINIYLNVTHCPIRTQVYKNKITLFELNYG